MYNKKITIEEFEAIVKDIAKKQNFTFPEYDNFGNVKVTTDGMVVIMRADAFHEAMKKEIKKAK